jgi:hypothetical protein
MYALWPYTKAASFATVFLNIPQDIYIENVVNVQCLRDNWGVLGIDGRVMYG